MTRWANKLTDAEVGDTIVFTYTGGSNPGETREVKITAVFADHIIGIDLDIAEEDGDENAYRQFRNDRLEGTVKIVSPTIPPTIQKKEYIPFTTARRVVQENMTRLTGEQLATLYGQVTGLTTGFDADSGCVTYDHRTEYVQDFSFNDDDALNGRVYVYNTNGSPIELWVDSEEQVVRVNGRPVAPSQLLGILRKHLDE